MRLRSGRRIYLNRSDPLLKVRLPGKRDWLLGQLTQFVQEAERWGIPHPSEAEARKLIEDAGFSLVSITYLKGDFPARFLQGVKPE